MLSWAVARNERDNQKMPGAEYERRWQRVVGVFVVLSDGCRRRGYRKNAEGAAYAVCTKAVLAGRQSLLSRCTVLR